MWLHSFFHTSAHTACNDSSDISGQTDDPCNRAQKLQIWKSSLTFCKELMSKSFPSFTGVFYTQVLHILQVKNRVNFPKLTVEAYSRDHKLQWIVLYSWKHTSLLKLRWHENCLSPGESSHVLLQWFLPEGMSQTLFT